MTLIIHEQRETMIVDTGRDGDRLWLTGADVEHATGWTLKPEGLCRGETCIPLSAQRRAPLVRDEAAGQRIDVAGLWRALGHPVARDDSGEVWVLGTRADDRADTLRALDAPDFRLPDLAGKEHALSDFRGKKVFLTTWASW